MDTVRALLDAKATRVAALCAVLVAGLLVTVGLLRTTPTYPINVNYSSAPGLFTGAAVDVLGVKVGTVTEVRNVGDKVHVVLAVDQGTKVPAGAFASLVAPQLLGSPDVDLNPGYTGGPALSAGATIPEDHTAVPVSTDEVLKELQKTLNALNPHAVGDLVTNLATDLDGQGANLNKLIASAAGTVQLLAEKGNDLGQLNGTLAQLTGTLDSDTANIESLVEKYDTVSTTVAQHSGQLNDAITQLAGASTGLVNLLVPNLQPLEADVGTVTTAGRTLDRNLSSVDEVLANGNSLFQGAERAYDPSYNWLDLNLQTSPGVSSAYIAGLIRDRLAGVCRRITANHSSGLSSSVLASLAQCGDPSSDFFDPLIDTIPNVLNSLTGQGGSTTEQSLMGQGLQQIADALGQRRHHHQQQHVDAGHAGALVEEHDTIRSRHHDDDAAGTEHDDHHESVRSPQRDPRLHHPDGCKQRLGIGRYRIGRLALERGQPGRRAAVDCNVRLDECFASVPPHLDRPGRLAARPTAAGPESVPAPRRHPPRPGRPVVARRDGVVVVNRATATTSRARTSARLVRLLAVPAAALVGALGLAGCSSGPSQRTASATFSDVGDLANGAQVQLADVPVGSVTSIALTGNKAKVTLAFDNGVRVPANVGAAIDRTTILGDQFVELTVPKSDTGPAARNVPQLANGATITHTSLVPDVEQFVAAGSQVFGAISSSELAQIIEAGGEGFTGQAATLKAFLNDLSNVTTGYAQHTADITQAVNGLNSLTSQLAPNDGATETALDNLAQTVSILAKNSSQFETLLQSLDNVSTQGRSLLETYYPQIVDQLQTLQAVSGQLAQHQADLAGLLSQIPLADNALPQAVRSGYVQLYENIIVCGLPGGGEDDNQPAFSCAKSGAGSGS